MTKISNSGVAVGSYESEDAIFHGFAFKDGTYTTIDVPNFRNVFAIAVNKFDNIIVQTQGASGPVVQLKGFCSAAF